MKSVNEQLEIIKRGLVELIPEKELIEKLRSGRPLKIKWGADPSAPDIHLGHTVVLNKLRQLQDLGHEVIFLVGDFTAMIGDPTGKSETRKALTKKEVETNAKTYQEQVFKILDKKKTKVVFNSTWLSKMALMDLVKLASQCTVARMLERKDFKERFKNESDISILEFLYPLFQGHDSVYLKADLEVGGTDQKFNLLMGRTLQQRAGFEPQVVLTLPLLEGTDGTNKMSKSLDNYIGITELPKEIFGKIMSISDGLMMRYYELLTDLPLEGIKTLHPKEAKVQLAKILVARFYDEKTAAQAASEFNSVFAQKNMPQDIPQKLDFIEKEVKLIDLLLTIKLVTSKAEAKRLIHQGGVSVDGVVINDENAMLNINETRTIRVGKRKFYQVKAKQ
ncbi:tyrosine--tRNA ligase [Candidatus Saganbacteria bacterium CG08_land_8_20_14_0_20_45_16]|uniref:Tyrosine--tRNA ligase n=1 Tax=Candidatus Saganbacteria bacterium CG08_land_8_20_14_0_20_45_16 TaxID=2014293 RepID=A0A2H0XZE4_UNCSA|nr:MAG: tyrosine--tRNA ligase [Candidatus Saganbacteria bacterium CG08_land_8_20_14_0_20_45_16]